MGAGADAKTFGRHGCPHSGIYAWLKSAPSEDATDVTSCFARMKLAVLAVSGEGDWLQVRSEEGRTGWSQRGRVGPE